MPFPIRFYVPAIPTIGYIHSSCVEGDAPFPNTFADHTNEIICDNRHLLREAVFCIAFVRQDEFYRPLTSVFGFREVGEWPGDPRFNAWVFENNRLMQLNMPIGYAEYLQVLHLEEQYRQRTCELEEFLAIRPDLGALEPEIDLEDIGRETLP